MTPENFFISFSNHASPNFLTIDLISIMIEYCACVWTSIDGIIQYVPLFVWLCLNPILLHFTHIIFCMYQFSIFYPWVVFHFLISHNLFSDSSVDINEWSRTAMYKSFGGHSFQFLLYKHLGMDIYLAFNFNNYIFSLLDASVTFSNNRGKFYITLFGW